MPFSQEILDQVILLSLLGTNILGFVFALMVIWRLLKK